MIYNFYMQQTDKSGAVVAGSQKDLENDFPGLKYIACTGLSSVGKPKNIYTENFAEASGFRTFHPTDTGGEVVHEATAVELELLFLGDNRRGIYDAFCSYLRAGRLYYWDTARHRKVWITLLDAVEPSEDVLKGSPYLRAPFKFSNLWGIGKACDDNGTLQ